MGRIGLFAFAFFIPVEDAADKRGDQGRSDFGAADGLGEAEQQGHVAVDPFFFEDFRSFDPFPGGGELDQDPFSVDAGGFVEGDQMAGFFHAAFDVKGEAGVDFGGDASGDDFQDLKAKIDKDLVDDLLDGLLRILRMFFSPLDRFFDKKLIFRFGRSCKDEGRICRGIGGKIFFDLFKFSSIGDDGR